MYAGASNSKPLANSPDTNNKQKRKIGSVLLFDSNNRMTLELTAQTMERLKGRTSLEAHEYQLLQRLTEIEPVKEVDPVIEVEPLALEDTLFGHRNIFRIEITSQLSPVLKERSELREHESRLPGQLAVIAFKSTGDSDSIGF